MRYFRYRLCAAVVFATAALFYAADALWIPAKAELAQYLLERAWLKEQRGVPNTRPWPWADTRPVGVLEVPRLGVRQLVLEGASGRNLAFGPAAVTSIDANDVVLSGHRDTHFRFLGELRHGDRLRLTRAGSTSDYRVAWREVVDSRSQSLVIDPARRRLTLVTCYPLDAPIPGGPFRYLVTALPAAGESRG